MDIQLTTGGPGSMLADVTGTADHVLRNRAVWDQWASSYAGAGLRSWSAAEPTWGIWGIPEAQAGMLPPGLDGADSIELGCGTGYVSAWLARRGARPVGMDNSPAQLGTARELQQRFGLRFPLFHANAERAPFADARFDLAICEYGASIWCDPYAWIPEAARLLRPGGQLIFLVNSVLLMLAIPDEDDLPATDRLLRAVLRHAPVRVARRRLGRVPPRPRRHDPAAAPLRPGGRGSPRAPPGPGAIASHPLATIEWARQWPCEEVWKARKILGFDRA